MLQRAIDYFRRGRPSQGPRRHVVEIAKIVCPIVLSFGVTALLALWLTEAFHSIQESEPAADETENVAGNLLDAKASASTEVFLGRYSTKWGNVELARGNPNREGVRVVEFEVAGLMRGSRDAIVHFERELDRYRNRLQQAMNEIARSSSEEELSDPQTISLRQRIRDRLNGLFGANTFDEVVFSNFRVYDL